MTETMRICLEGTAAAAAQVWFAHKFLGVNVKNTAGKAPKFRRTSGGNGKSRGVKSEAQREQPLSSSVPLVRTIIQREVKRCKRTMGVLFCILGGTAVNLLPADGSVKLLIYTLLLYGFTRAFSGCSPKAAAVCTAVSVTALQGCCGVMGGLEGLFIIGTVRCGIQLCGEWLCLLCGLLPSGLFIFIGRRIVGDSFSASVSGNPQNTEDTAGYTENLPQHTVSLPKYNECLPATCLLPMLAASVYINSVICAVGDNEKIYIIPCAVQLTVILAVKGFSDICRKAESAFVYRQYCVQMNQILGDTAIIRHDLKNHMLTVGALAERGEFESLRKYAESLSENSGRLTGVYSTGMPALDALISRKLSGAEGVKICCKVRIPQGDFDETDLCGIFGNALDNAFEGCKETAAPFIDLRTAAMGGMLLIECKNNCEVGGFKEGTGLRSIRRTAKKYGGSALASKEGNVFCLRIVLNSSRRSSGISRRKY